MKLSPEAKSLVRAARRGDAGPSDAARDRMRQRALAATIATAAATGATATGTAAAAGAGSVGVTAAATTTTTAGLAGWFGALGLGTKLGIAAIGLAVVGGGVATATGVFREGEPDRVTPSTSSTSSTSRSTDAAPSASATPRGETRALEASTVATPGAETTAEPTAPAESAPIESATPRVEATARTGAAGLASGAKTSAPEEDALLEETALLGRAQQRLSGGDAAGALTLLDEHAVRFPKGALSVERKGLRALALCALGRADEGRAEAANVLAGSSPLADRIRAACH